LNINTTLDAVVKLIWTRLTEPNASFDTPERRWRARLAASSFLVAASFLVVHILLDLVISREMPLIHVAALVIILALQQLCRTRFLEWALRAGLAALWLLSPIALALLPENTFSLRLLIIWPFVVTIIAHALYGKRVAAVILIASVIGIARSATMNTTLQIDNLLITISLAVELILLMSVVITFGQLQASDRARLTSHISVEERRIRQMIDNVADLIVKTDRNLIIEYVSYAAFTVLGYQPVEFEGRSLQAVFELMHPDEKDVIAERLQYVIKTGQSLRTEYRLRHKDGHYVWLETISNFLLAPDGQIEAIVFTGRDISERIEAQKRLDHTQYYYHTLVESVDGMIWEMDAETFATTYISPQMERMFGYNRHHIMNDPMFWAYHIHPEHWQEMAEKNRELVQTKRSHTVEYRLYDANRDLHWVRAHISPVIQDGKVKSIIGINIDVTEQKQADQALALSRYRYENLITTLDAVFYESSLDYTAHYKSPQIERLMGYPVQQFMDDPNFWLTLIHPDDLTEIMAKTSAFVAEQQNYRIEYRMITAAGRTIWVQDTVRFGNDPSGEERLFGLIVEITALKEAQAAEQEQRRIAESLRESAAALTDLVEHDDILDRILTQARHIFEADAINVMMVEGDQLHIVRAQGYEKFDDGVRAAKFRVAVEAMPNIHRILETKNAIVIPNVADDAEWISDGTARWIQSHASAPVRLNGEVIGFIHLDSHTADSFNQTTAEQLQAFANQAAIAIRNAQLFSQVKRYAEELEFLVQERTGLLEQERRQLSAILNAMTEGVAYVEQKAGTYQTLYTNRALVKMSGYAEDEWRKTDMTFFRAPDSTPEAELRRAAAIVETLDKGGTWQEELKLKRKNGMLFDAALTSSRVNNADGVMVGTVTVLRDISQEKMLAEQRARFIAHASHELRTPITNLITRLYLLRKRPEMLQEHLNILDDVANRMKRLVNDLLDVSQFERGATQINRKPMDVGAMLADVTRLQMAEAERKAISLRYVDVQPALRIDGDRERLTQVITNLVINAINYTPDGGSVTVSLREVPHEEMAEIVVEDTGLGIPAEHLPQIFQPFFRVPNESGVKGSGLGLSIARELVEMHGGQISVESEVNKGSRFILWLPLLAETSEIVEPLN
jgi:PAS domain S-box-containing protein